MTANVYTLSSGWDLKIKVNEYENVNSNSSLVKRLTASAIFEAERSKLAQSEHFSTMLRGPWREASSKAITLEEDNIEVMTVLFRSLHGTLDEIAFNTVSMKTIWLLIQACDKYNIDIKTGALRDWFINWYEVESKRDENQDGYEFERMVMYPCYHFDHAVGFQEATLVLVYNSPGHITEKNPTKNNRLHMPPRVIQQMNSARGRLRNILSNGLFNDIAAIVEHAKCSCKETTVFDYLRELQRVKVWPLENTMKNASVNDLLHRCRLFKAANMRRPARGEKTGISGYSLPRSCSCGNDWKGVVTRAANKVADNFNGMCLDCMSVTACLRQGRDLDAEYWEHDRMKKWDLKCRVKHGEPTWWFSFMGQREKRGLLAY
ncbi:hypothetical protein BJX99DRAFT_225856 [Aspergillus californicus]